MILHCIWQHINIEHVIFFKFEVYYEKENDVDLLEEREFLARQTA